MRIQHSFIIPVLFSLVFLAQSTAFAANATTPVSSSGAQSAVTKTTTSNSQTQDTAGSFVPLTQLPAIQQASNAATLPAFFNSIYKILIGLAAVLAVLMIMVAGVQFMTSRGSVSSNEKAKSNIQNAILGLIIVLSPVIVFGIINPKILNLDFTSDLQQLQAVKSLQNTDTSFSTGAQQKLQCDQITDKKLVNYAQGQDPASVCSAIGNGWHSYPECYSGLGNNQAFCGFSKGDVKTPTPPTPEEQKGNYGFDFALRGYDGSDKDNGYCISEHSYHYTTSQACTAALSSARSSAKDPYAYSDNCSGKVAPAMTPQSTYSQLQNLHSCQE